jgi:methylated-DNA-[protein]-cysteine S-methyltransferase
MIAKLLVDSPVGTLCLCADRDALVGVYLPEQTTPAVAVECETPLLAAAAAQLAEYFAGSRRTFVLPLAAAGTAFQQRVWSVLRTIPFGQTWTYQQVASALGRPTATRAVGAANGKNPLSIIVPCHRVIGARGTLTGYAGGLAAKRQLLAHERGIADA